LASSDFSIPELPKNTRPPSIQLVEINRPRPPRALLHISNKIFEHVEQMLNKPAYTTFRRTLKLALYEKGPVVEVTPRPLQGPRMVIEEGSETIQIPQHTTTNVLLRLSNKIFERVGQMLKLDRATFRRILKLALYEMGPVVQVTPRLLQGPWKANEVGLEFMQV